MPTFRFKARWKEELVCSGPGGTIILDLPMGVIAAYLPAERVWRSKAPEWARDLWPVLKMELKAWCVENRAKLVIDETAGVF